MCSSGMAQGVRVVSISVMGSESPSLIAGVDVSSSLQLIIVPVINRLKILVVRMM